MSDSDLTLQEVENIYKVLEDHRKWLYGEKSGERAELIGRDLRGAPLIRADLRHARMEGSDFLGAKLSGADLRCAYLSSANLQEVDLQGANLRSANLTGANLTNADIRWAIGNGQEIKTLIVGVRYIAWTATDLAIGCEQHPIEDWWKFDDDTIDAMDDHALAWWRQGKPVLRALIETSNKINT